MSEVYDWAQMIASSNDAFEPVPVGVYDAVVDSAEATQSSTGKLMFKVKYKITAGPKVGSTIFNNVTMTVDNKKALYMFFENMEAMGIARSQFKQQPPLTPHAIAQLMIGNAVQVDVDHRAYQGVMRENVKGLKRASGFAGGGAVPQMPTAGPVPQPMAPAPAPIAAPVASPPPVATPPAVESTKVPMAEAAAGLMAGAAAQESTINIPAPASPVPPEAAPAPAAFAPPPALPF